jgi:alkylhydroperoxidase family enzyme
MADNASFLGEPPTDPAVAAAYRANVDSEGYVRNLIRVWSWRPDVATAFEHLRNNLLAASGLSAREVAVLVAAAVAARGDSYCALAWGTRLADLADPATAAALLADADAHGDGDTDGDGDVPAGLSEREAALARWARLVARDPNGTSDADVARLRDAGFGDREIFEATTWVALRMAFSAWPSPP